jgi:hypothetical protein
MVASPFEGASPCRLALFVTVRRATGGSTVSTPNESPE